MTLTNLGRSSTCDVIWHHRYPTAAGGKDFSNTTQTRVIALMEPEIFTKMLKKLSEKLRAKFPAKKITKIEKPTDVGHFLSISIFVHAQAKMSKKAMLVARKLQMPFGVH